MRISQIRSLRDAGWWCVDQDAHAAIVLAALGWIAKSGSDVMWGGGIILLVREIEQARETVEEWRERLTDEWTLWELILDLHLPDRILDVAVGALAARGAWQLIHTLVS